MSAESWKALSAEAKASTLARLEVTARSWLVRHPDTPPELAQLFSEEALRLQAAIEALKALS